jgi:hypothetical protein
MTYTREDVTFISEGLSCKGWLYRPKEHSGKRPTIVMAHGFSAVKEMYLPNFAERFAEAGFIVLVFDYRFIGESEGEPRQQVIPAEQIKDYRNAITWVSQQEQVDAERIGIWGSSYSGGHVLSIAARDRRVKAVVSQAPCVDGFKNAQLLSVASREQQDPTVEVQLPRLSGFTQVLQNYRQARYDGAPIEYMPVVAPEGEKSALPTPDSFDWFTRAGATIAPNWVNQVTMETMEAYLDYYPTDLIDRISPTPLLMIVAENDEITPTELAVAAYERAKQPKKLEMISGGHFSAYTEPGLSSSAPAALAWFKKHLTP